MKKILSIILSYQIMGFGSVMLVTSSAQADYSKQDRPDSKSPPPPRLVDSDPTGTSAVQAPYGSEKNTGHSIQPTEGTEKRKFCKDKDDPEQKKWSKTCKIVGIVLLVGLAAALIFALTGKKKHKKKHRRGGGGGGGGGGGSSTGGGSSGGGSSGGCCTQPPGGCSGGSCGTPTPAPGPSGGGTTQVPTDTSGSGSAPPSGSGAPIPVN